MGTWDVLFEYGGEVADGSIHQEPLSGRIVEGFAEAQGPSKPDDPAKPASPFDPASSIAPLAAAKAPGTGLLIDTTA